MAVLSDTSIRNLQETGDLGISSFDPDALQPASYDMRLYWKILLSPTRYEVGREVDLREEREQTLALEPGRFAAILTEEILELPLDMSGRFGLRSEFTRKGLVAFPGIQVDPGFRGRLAISLFNAGPEAIGLRYGNKMFTIEFHTLESPASHGYEGDYQEQHDFPPDQTEFILNAQTVSLSEIQTLPTEMSNLELRLTRHERTHEHSTPSIAELAESQGVTPLDDLSQLTGFWPEDEDVHDFMRAVRGWRGR
jgi:dCTP deaminase